MDLRYKLNDRPPVGQLLLYSLQWFVLAVAVVILLVFGNDPMGRFFNKFFTGRWIEKLWNKMEPKANRKNHYDE